MFSTLQGSVTCSPSAAVWSGGSRMNFCTSWEEVREKVREEVKEAPLRIHMKANGDDSELEYGFCPPRPTTVTFAGGFGFFVN